MSAQGYMAIVAGMALLGAAAAWPLENPGDQSPRVTQEGLSDLAVAGDRGASLLAYHTAAIRYALANPGFTGTVPEASLSLPAGYAGLPGTEAVVTAKYVVTYPAGGVPAYLAPAEIAMGAARASRFTAGTAISTAAGYVGVGRSFSYPTPPVPVPEGLPLLVTGIR